MKTAIRQAERADIPALVTVIGTAFKKAAARLGLPPREDSKHASNIADSWIADDMEKGVRYFILEADGLPAGAVTVGHARPDVSFIGRLSVVAA